MLEADMSDILFKFINFIAVCPWVIAMTFIKLIVLFILITMMEHHGIIYRTGKHPDQEKGSGVSSKIPRGRDIVYGTWRLSGVNTDEPVRILPYEEPVRNDQGSKKELLISFFPDSTFTQIGTKGEYLSGRWGYDSLTRSLFLTLGRRTEEVPLSFDVAANGLRLMTFEFGNKHAMSLIEDGKPVSRYQDDPFYPTNNRWRVKPGKPEDKKQLASRLENYLLHCASVLRAAEIREQKRVSLEFSKGIIRLYNVGIGIVPHEKIPQSWIDGFFSTEDALKAYRMYEDYLQTARHKKSRTGNWVRDDYQILVDIHNGLAKRY
jgi:hypothetical protein